jgi:FtsP/CotA-like multicopper oxidase with cupredoxin domain
VRLQPAPSPFGASVTAEGVHRWDLAFSLARLPAPSSLGPYRAYVAWATTPALDPVLRLGEVADGERTLGPVALEQFLVLVSAEASADADRRTGPIVLRGASASTRLQPHDLGRVLSVAAGAPGGAGGAAGARRDGHLSHRTGDGADRWPPSPMHPAVSMPVGLMRLRPDVSPWLPDSAPAAPRVRAAPLLDLADGDTLELAAGPVRRTVAGREVTMLGFNGSHPGPLVRVARGSTVVVRFTNSTAWPTSVHWHGVRLENRFDGVPGVTQEPVPPGGRFTYRVRFPDAGIYWYHPHHRSDVQQDLGLYGNLWVRGGDPPPVDREELLMLDDLLVGETGLVPWGREAATHALMGRFGNLALVNGEPRYGVEVDRGAVVRFHLTNASNARTWNVSFPDAPMKVVAGDLGAFERQERVESVVLAPAERYAVDVHFPEAGVYPLVNRVRAIDPFRGRFFSETDTLGIVRVRSAPARKTDRPDRTARDGAAAFRELRADTRAAADLARYRAALERPVDRELVLTLEPRGLPFPIEPLLGLESVFAPAVEWTGTMPEMNAAATAGRVRWVLRDPATGAEDEGIRWSFRAGDLVKIRITNDRAALHAMHHPIHVHGQRFLVVRQGGVPRRNLVWKDTLLLPAGDVAEILLDASNPGRWMLHCHTAEHLEAGMRTVFTVEPAEGEE